jgi:hypothetical protein
VIYVPSVAPTQEDLIRAATIFEFRGRQAVLNGHVHVTIGVPMHDETADWLSEHFGGAVYLIGATRRWQVRQEQLATFLTAIRPWLKPQGLRKADSIVKASAALEEATVESSARLANRKIKPKEDVVKDRREFLKLWDEEFDEPMAQAAYDGILSKGKVVWFETGLAVAALYAAWFREHGCIVEEENGCKLGVTRTDDGVEREHFD